MMSRRLVSAVMVATLIVSAAACGSGDEGTEGDGDGDAVTLSIESWRADDEKIWEDSIIPAFEEDHPDIKLKFEPTAPTEYNATLSERLGNGSAGDIITCRPFDLARQLFEEEHLTSVADIEGIDNFDEMALNAWATDDGDPYCVPAASVIHGFYYNKDAFDELGLEPPETVDDFHTVLDDIKADGTYTPIAQGTTDMWDIAEVDYTGIGPNYWKGEEGRQALIDGSAKFTDPQFVAPLEEMATWGQYMPDGYEALSYDDAKVVFGSEKGAIFPGGSWEIPGFEADAGFEIGVFKPPVLNEGDQCYISDQNDHGFAMNAATDHADEVETFLEWVASEDFPEVYSNALAGFFPMQTGEFEVENEVASEFLSWRDECEATIRLPLEKLNQGDPALMDELSEKAAEVVNGDKDPATAAQELQTGLDSWYTPGE